MADYQTFLEAFDPADDQPPAQTQTLPTLDSDIPLYTEHAAKEMLSQLKISCPPGRLVTSAAEARKPPLRLMGPGRPESPVCTNTTQNRGGRRCA
ncbi:MAG: hypothetical protein CM1200mP41_03280 [Gammaproteobacteria bacterium]|nr:MAG: hypothetical protein CM1200mP41_03280 [Gammaproteobacteria bacterium]